MEELQEPVFAVFPKDVADTDVGLEASKSDFIGVEPVRTFESFDECMNFIDNGDYFWYEAHTSLATEKTVCNDCDLTIKTHSEERVQHARTMHHYSKGH